MLWRTNNSPFFSSKHNILSEFVDNAGLLSYL
jgi:hypothetical protein